MDRLLAKRPIYRHDPPPDNPDALETFIAKHAPLRPCFRSEEEFEYFCMLPLGFKDKLAIIKRIAADQALMDEVLQCEGREDTNVEHRQLCVACVCVRRPSIAEPYY